MTAGHRILNREWVITALNGELKSGRFGTSVWQSGGKRPPRNSLVHQTIFPQPICTMYRRDPAVETVRDDVIPRGHAGSPGSDGASPYLRRTLLLRRSLARRANGFCPGGTEARSAEGCKPMLHYTVACSLWARGTPSGSISRDRSTTPERGKYSIGLCREF
jgi:hypothetical protein